jgi:hypothetical protein
MISRQVHDRDGGSMRSPGKALRPVDCTGGLRSDALFADLRRLLSEHPANGDVRAGTSSATRWRLQCGADVMM